MKDVVALIKQLQTATREKTDRAAVIQRSVTTFQAETGVTLPVYANRLRHAITLLGMTPVV